MLSQLFSSHIVLHYFCVMLLLYILVRILLLCLEVYVLWCIYYVLLYLFFPKPKSDSYLKVYNALPGGCYLPNKYKGLLKPVNADIYLKQNTDTGYTELKISNLHRAWSSYWRNEIFNVLFTAVNNFYVAAFVMNAITPLKKNIKVPK